MHRLTYTIRVATACSFFVAFPAQQAHQKKLLTPFAIFARFSAGTTRDHFAGKRVIRLEYEAYDAMALKKMREICSDMRSRWGLTRIAMLHRVGYVFLHLPFLLALPGYLV